MVIKPGKGFYCMLSVGNFEIWPCTKPGKVQKVVMCAEYVKILIWVLQFCNEVFLYNAWPSVLSLNNIKIHKTKTVKNISIQEEILVDFNLELALPHFRTIRPQVNLVWARDPIEDQHSMSGQFQRNTWLRWALFRCAHAPTSNTASHDKHEKINSLVFFVLSFMGMMLRY